jgi:putative heme iron utilization protein
VEFTWEGNDEMEETSGHGWAELRQDGSLDGEICLENGDEIPFAARRSATSSTAC